MACRSCWKRPAGEEHRVVQSCHHPVRGGWLELQDMRLTLQVHHVSSLDWSSGPTALGDGAIGRLLINRADLAAELLRDRRLTGVHFELVQPCESCRILAVSDIVEPRAKLEPAGRDFP